MKFALTLLAVVAAAGTTNAFEIPKFGEGPLHDDLQEFLKLVPQNEIVSVVLEYAGSDPEFQAVLEVLTGNEFKELVKDVQTLPEVIKVLDYLEGAGIYAYKILAQINKMLGIDDITVLPYYVDIQRTGKITGGLSGLIQDVMHLIPVGEILALHMTKMEVSTAYVGLVEQVMSPNFVQIGKKIRLNLHYHKVMEKIRGISPNTQQINSFVRPFVGLDMEEVIALLNRVELVRHFKDFMKIYPVREGFKIVHTYFKQDQETRKAVKYVHSEEFKKLVYKVEALKEFQALAVYLYNVGLDVFEKIQMVHKFLDMDEYVPPVGYSVNAYETVPITGGVNGLLIDLKAITPYDEINALHQEKLKTSKIFAHFVANMKSGKMVDLLKDLASQNVFLEIRRKSKDNGVDFVAINAYAMSLIGF